MNLVAIVPIRSGSKGLPNKNVLPFNGKPLVCQTIQALIDSTLFLDEDIYVSTDSMEYINLITKYFPNISFHHRDAKLASDSSSTGDFLKIFLERFDRKQNFILCQATSPLRSGKQIKEAYDLFQKKDQDTVVSVTKTKESESLFTRLSSEGRLEDIVGIDKGYRRQKKQVKYMPNGAIYISNVGTYLDEVSFFTQKTLGYIMDEYTSIDIDNEVDFMVAQVLSQNSDTRKIR